MRIKLLADQWDQLTNKGYVRHFVGAVVEATDSDARRLIGCGAAKSFEETTEEPGVDGGDADAAGDSDAEEHAASNIDAGADEPAVVGSPRKRPPKSGKLEDWQSYVASLGVDVKGLNRQELIAAADKLENQ